MTEFKFSAEFSGSYPTRCSGTWSLYCNGLPIAVPEDKRNRSMETFGSYDSWSFGESWGEEWESYTDGDLYEEWIEDNIPWVSRMLESHNILANAETFRSVYDAFQSDDFRNGSCGGCIL